MTHPPTTRYELVPAESRLAISARSTTHPIQVEAGSVHGEFRAADGDAPGFGSPARLVVDVAGLQSGNLLIDRETRRRLDLRRHPSISAEVTSAHPTGESGCFRCEGTVTVMGVTRPASGEISVEVGADGAIRLHGQQTFDVREWGLQPPRLLVLRVQPEVEVTLDVWGRPVAQEPLAG